MGGAYGFMAQSRIGSRIAMVYYLFDQDAKRVQRDARAKRLAATPPHSAASAPKHHELRALFLTVHGDLFDEAHVPRDLARPAQPTAPAVPEPPSMWRDAVLHARTERV